MISIDLSVFPKERELKLKSINRYSMFEVMLYRPNLWMHSHRVLWLCEELLPLAQKYINLDPEKVRALAFVHDDVEMLTGDIQLGHKARMTEEQLKAIGNAEEEAVKTLAKKYPKKVHGYSYQELLLHASRKDCLEAQLVSYLDKVDAYCESLHEILAGNSSLLRAVILYTNILDDFPKKFPDLAPLLFSKESSLTYLRDRVSPLKVEVKRYGHLNKPHTKESLKIETDFPFYNTWRRLVLERGGKEGLDWLVSQKESLPT